MELIYILIASVLTYQIWLGKQVVDIKVKMSKIITWINTTNKAASCLIDSE